MVMRVEVDPGGKFRTAVQQAIDEVDDLTIPFREIARSWFKSNRAIFALKGPGKYVDLSAGYKLRKQKRWGFIYPILKASGALAASITVPNAKGAIHRVINKKALLLGSSVPYGAFHQLGGKHLPQRPWVLVGPEQVSPPELNRRAEAWVKIIQDYVLARARQRLEG
jgi:phage gpG-like protein